MLLPHSELFFHESRRLYTRVVERDVKVDK
mgnify:CR=1 FL=1